MCLHSFEETVSVYFQKLSTILKKISLKAAIEKGFSLLAYYKAFVATSKKYNALIHSSYRLWLVLWTTRMTRMRMRMKAKRAAPQKEHDWTLPSICLGAASARGAGSCVASQPGQNFDNCIRNIMSQQEVETCREHERRSREIQCQEKIPMGRLILRSLRQNFNQNES